MTSFLDEAQRELVNEIAGMLTARGETVSIAEGTTGGLVSAALLSVAGASRYFAGGGVLYTLNSRVQLAGVPPEMLENYRGTTPEIILAMADSMRERLGSTWCLAESGLAGPTTGRSGLPPGRTTLGVSGPLRRTEVFVTDSTDREANMTAFTTASLRFLRDAIVEAGG